MRRREDGERDASKSADRSERVESSWGGDGGPADLKNTEGQGHAHLCHTSMPVRNGNIGSDRTATTKGASVRKQLGPKNSKSNGPPRVTTADRRRMMELREETGMQLYELDRETGQEQITVGWTRRKDGGWQNTEESGRVTWAGQEETREAKAEMEGLC